MAAQKSRRPPKLWTTNGRPAPSSATSPEVTRLSPVEQHACRVALHPRAMAGLDQEQLARRADDLGAIGHEVPNLAVQDVLAVIQRARLEPVRVRLDVRVPAPAG